MFSLALFGTVARSAVIGAIITKAIDTLVISKLNNKMETKRWIRTTKLELFSNLSEDLLLLDSENIDEKIRNIKHNSAKIVLLLQNRNLIRKIDDHILALHNLSNKTFINKEKLNNKIKSESMDFIMLLNKNIQRI
ncbi:MAG: hypothetical protein MJK08_07935 [Campylobacterales bacterium]|nr:hypothetical protein [Campylobacterales bacterium]NQY21283.1 hypothetical protein [Campylobacteraceae bacterium]NQY53356.1 hypothetical protein [Campylobacteraceae bacterium]